MSTLFLSIDPGKDKSGFALMDFTGAIFEKKVVFKPLLIKEIIALYKKYNFTKIIIGNAKIGKIIEADIKSLHVPFEIIFTDEEGSTLKARSLFWKENKPRGIWRFFPESLRVPYKPYDDFAAVVIGREYLNAIDKAL